MQIEVKTRDTLRQKSKVQLSSRKPQDRTDPLEYFCPPKTTVNLSDEEPLLRPAGALARCVSPGYAGPQPVSSSCGDLTDMTTLPRYARARADRDALVVEHG